jgi:hypothetical protein
VRVRPDIDALAGRKYGWAHLIEKDEGTDHAAFGGWQDTAHSETAEIVLLRSDDELDAVRAWGACRFDTGPCAHMQSPQFSTAMTPSR